MFIEIATLFFLLVSLISAEDLKFTYNGFQSSRVALDLDGSAGITSNGLLELTGNTVQKTGYAFYGDPIKFKKDSPDNTLSSFSTTFVFAIISEYAELGAHGMAFVIAPTRGLPGAFPSQYLGLFNASNNGVATNHVVAVELDTVESNEFGDINNNHVGIDINGLRSVVSAPTAYFVDSAKKFENISLISGKPMQVWVEYDGFVKQMNVTIAPMNVVKPGIPLLSLSIDLSPIIDSSMSVGFSSSTGSLGASQYILGWSFKVNSLQPEKLNLTQLPRLPYADVRIKEKSQFLKFGLPVVLSISVVGAISGVFYVIKRKRKFAEEFEDWEVEYGPHRFKFKDLHIATKGFKGKELLGAGGFGKVYKGILPKSNLEVAVKKVSHESRQGMKEFVAEIVSMGQLRHRNLVQLLGYCRRRGELLLVYDYMPNGSLDKYLYGQPKVILSWSQRFKVIKGVASGLLYLHEGWRQVVIHRDVKASNVLLDTELNGRLGDFGLARMCDHETDPQTTHVAGTLGYLAPEYNRTGKATTSTDVYAFGAFLLEVTCGRRPIERKAPPENVILVDWVFSCYMRGQILEATDAKLSLNYVADEVVLVLKLGLLCSHSEPNFRPTMRQVVQYLNCDVDLPELTTSHSTSSGTASAIQENVIDFAQLSLVEESILSGGR